MIYAEVHGRAGVDVLWERTQGPALRQRWDLRLGEIGYHDLFTARHVNTTLIPTRIRPSPEELRA